MLQHLARLLFLCQTFNMKSISVGHKKRGRPATGKTPRVSLRLDDQATSLIEQFRLTLGKDATQSDAIRELLIIALREKGYLSNG